MEAIFFPRNDYPNNIEVCNHRFGKSMTYSESTDTLNRSAFYKVMALCEQYGIKVGAFTNAITDNVSDSDVFPYIESDLLWTDLYWRYTEMLRDTDVTQSIFIEKNAEQIESFIGRWGRKPVTMSYALGNYTYKDYVPFKYLGGRNSLYLDADTDYGKSFGGTFLGTPANEYTLNRFTFKSSSTRFYDYAADIVGYDSALQHSKDLIDATYLNHGWLNNFSHWHDYINHDHEDWLNGYFAMLAQKKSQYNNDIHFCGYGEAVAYLVYRSMISKAVMYSPTKNANTQLIIRLEAKNSVSLDGLNTTSIDTDLLQVPISIKFSTTGTPLAGQNIKSGCSLITLGNNQYIVEIPYAEYPGAVIEKVSI